MQKGAAPGLTCDICCKRHFTVQQGLIRIELHTQSGTRPLWLQTLWMDANFGCACVRECACLCVCVRVHVCWGFYDAASALAKRWQIFYYHIFWFYESPDINHWVTRSLPQPHAHSYTQTHRLIIVNDGLKPDKPLTHTLSLLTVFIHWFQQNLNSSLSMKPSPFVSKTAKICSRRSCGTS